MRITFRQIGPVIATLGVLVLITGCAKPIAEPDEIVHTPDFFSANKWVDHDSSGGADYLEFEGANKWTYHSHEDIEFVSRIRCPVGSNVYWQLRAPTGALVADRTSDEPARSEWQESPPLITLLP